MSDARRTHDTDAGTDPRYHAAFQRGYDGPAPERGAKAEERFRRPRRRDAAATRPRTTALPTSEPVLDPIRALGFEAPIERTATLPTDVDEAAAEESGTEPEVPVRSALDVRVPLGLAVMGAVLLAVGVVLLWSSSSAYYFDNGTTTEQFLRGLGNVLPGPMITVGLVSVGGALAVKAARS